MATATEAPATRGRAPDPALAGMNEEQIKEYKKQKAKEAREKLPKFAIPTGGLREVPSDFVATRYQRLTRKEFAAEHFYLDFNAGELERRATRMRQEANNIRAFGDVKDTKKAKKLLKAKRDFEALKAQLEASEDGINIAELLKSLG